MDNPFLGELALVFLAIFFVVAVVPLLAGLGLAFICDLSGVLFYGTVIGVAVLIWIILYVCYYLQ